MSVKSEDLKVLKPEELLEKFNHPSLYYDESKDMFIFKLTHKRVIYRWKFSYKYINTPLDFEEMLIRIHKKLEFRGVEMTGCGCEERKRVADDQYKEFISMTESLYDNEEEYWY